MTKEEMLRDYILSKYRSVLEFTETIGMPYSTISTIFRRGIDTANIQNIIKICQELEISADALAEGRIESVRHDKDKPTRIEDVIFETKQILYNTKNLTLNGIQANYFEIMHIIFSLDATFNKRHNFLLCLYCIPY